MSSLVRDLIFQTRKKINMLKTMNVLLAVTLTTFVAQAQTENEFKGKIEKDFKSSQQWWPEKSQAPKDAPNVLLVLIDDAGYGTSSAFGGLMQTPTFDSLANHGLRYTNFHTTAICSPTRASLLT
jgi:hypothetical protein